MTYRTLAATLGLALGPLAASAEDLDAALRESAGKRAVIVFVHALWCPPCNALRSEILDTDDRKTAIADAVFLDIDAETEAGYAVVRRYGIIGYPTTLVLDPTGEERDRVEGYPGRDAFLAALGDARLAKNGLAALEAAALAKPGDEAVAIALAQARLVRGDPRGATALRSAIEKGGPLGAEAGRILGRYFLRVRKEGSEGTDIFRDLMTRFAGTEDAVEFRLWAAQGLSLQGKKREAVALIDEWLALEPKSAGPVTAKASFLLRFGYPALETRAALDAAIALDSAAPGPHYLLAELALAQGDLVLADHSIRRALALAPDKPLYRNFAERLGKSGAQ